MKIHAGTRLLAALSVAAMLGGVGIASAAEDISTLARGGRLYDNWFSETKAAKPTADHPAYPNKGGEYGKDVSWRCKECHGWDYKGKDGAYGSGKHATGIIGIKGSIGKDPAEISALLRAELHGYTEEMLGKADMDALALFVSKGQIDMDKYVDPATGKPIGDAAKGEIYYNTICAGCHGVDGKKVKDVPLGAFDNPPELMHRVLNGMPAEAMTALRALDPQIAADIGSYLVTVLPQ